MRSTQLNTKQVPLTPEEALAAWKQNVMFALEDLQEALNTPLPTARTVYSEVHPDEPGFAQAPYEVHLNSHPLVFKHLVEPPTL